MNASIPSRYMKRHVMYILCIITDIFRKFHHGCIYRIILRTLQTLYDINFAIFHIFYAFSLRQRWRISSFAPRRPANRYTNRHLLLPRPPVVCFILFVLSVIICTSVVFLPSKLTFRYLPWLKSCDVICTKLQSHGACLKRTHYRRNSRTAEELYFYFTISKVTYILELRCKKMKISIKNHSTPKNKLAIIIQPITV